MAKVQANAIFKEANRSKCRYVLLKGSAGSGKSVDTAQHYVLRLMADAGRNLLAMRKSEVSNRDSTYRELQGAIYRMGREVSRLWKMKENPLEMQFLPNGNKIVFRGMNDNAQREKLKSITFAHGKLTDIWLEEATEFTQGDVEILDDRLRGELPHGLFYQMRFTFNPVSANHWIKRSYFDMADETVYTHHSTYLDNRFNDAAFHERMLRRKRLDPEGYRIYGLGEWGEPGGLIISPAMWRVEEISAALTDYDGVAMGQDFGYNHANAILLLGYKDGNIYIIEELYVREMDTNEVIALARARGLGRNVSMYCDSAEPDRIAMWRKAGFRAQGVKKERGSVGAQIDWLKGREILVHPRCEHTIREISQWKWKRDEATGAYLDEPVPFDDDAMAALRYGVEGWRKVRGGVVRVQGSF